MFGSQTVSAVSENRSPFHDVLQLAHISRPRMSLEDSHEFCVHARRRRIAATGPQEIFREWRNVFCMLAKRRQFERKYRQAIQQVLAKLSFPNQRAQVGIGRRHHAHIHPHRFRASQPLNLMLLEEAKQLRLHSKCNVSNLVQE